MSEKDFSCDILGGGGVEEYEWVSGFRGEILEPSKRSCYDFLDLK